MVSVPLLLSLDGNIEDMVEISLAIGTYYDWCFANTLQSENVIQKNILNQHDMGLMGMVNLRMSKIFIGYEVKRGCLDLQPNNLHGKTYRLNNMFKVGYIF